MGRDELGLLRRWDGIRWDGAGRANKEGEGDGTGWGSQGEGMRWCGVDEERRGDGNKNEIERIG